MPKIINGYFNFLKENVTAKLINPETNEGEDTKFIITLPIHS